MKHDLYELSVTVPSKPGSSTKIPEYGHKGLTLVEGRKGQNFYLKLRNDSAHRVLAVVSVDGVNVLNGEKHSEARGYVLPAYSAYEITGWRTNNSTTHDFTFVKKAKSYAKGGGNGMQDCGVIAAKFFSEKVTPPVYTLPVEPKEEHHHHHRHYPPAVPWSSPFQPNIIWCGGTSQTGVAGNLPSNSSSYSCGLNSGALQGGNIGAMNVAAPKLESPGVSTWVTDTSGVKQSDIPKFNLGTGWGDARTSEVTDTVFEREAELCTLVLYYAEAADLKKVGVVLTKNAAVSQPAPVLPQAFAGFCKPPVNQ